jgi:hypothetical protein
MGILTWQITDGQIDFANNTITELTDGDALAQRIENALKLWLGEWFLEPLEGIDWIDLLEAKPANLAEIERVVRATIEADPAITNIIEYDQTFTRATRSLLITFTADGDTGLVRGEVAI